MLQKLKTMQENPDLLKKFQEAVKRADHLMATVNLCNESIELFLFKLDRSGVDKVKFNDYSEVVLEDLNKMLDARAKTMKDQWVGSYTKLANSDDVDGWFLDLTGQDYAVLGVGTSTSTMKYYELNWTFRDLANTARFISDHCNSDPEALERLRQK